MAVCTFPQPGSSQLLDWQDPLYKYNGYLSLLEFREQTLQRLKKFVDQRFFSVRDYLDSRFGSPQTVHCYLRCTTLGSAAGGLML
jgi:hypothetical protein